MKVLIAKVNQSTIATLLEPHINLSKINFTEKSKNTCFFSVSTRTFNKLHQEAVKRGYNPYALMAW